jgi:hypothetical protein
MSLVMLQVDSAPAAGTNLAVFLKVLADVAASTLNLIIFWTLCAAATFPSVQVIVSLTLVHPALASTNVVPTGSAAVIVPAVPPVPVFS